MRDVIDDANESMKPATIVIITYNSADTIGACLAAVAQLEPQGTFELVVLDNASNDGTIELVRAQFPGVHVIAESENWGFAGGVNRAVAQAQGAHILLLNPDAQPDSGWAAALVAALAGRAWALWAAKS